MAVFSEWLLKPISPTVGQLPRFDSRYRLVWRLRYIELCFEVNSSKALESTDSQGHEISGRKAVTARQEACLPRCFTRNTIHPGFEARSGPCQDERRRV